MQLTNVLRYRHPEYLHYESHYWDRLPKIKKFWYKQWRRTFFLKRNKKILKFDVQVPPSYNVHNALDFVKDKCEKFALPYVWPYEKPFEEGSSNDPKYKQTQAHFFNRKTVILEGYKGAMNFTNTVLEADNTLPSPIVDLEKNITISDDYIKLLSRKLTWAHEEDGLLRKLPKSYEFPKLNKPLRREFGVPVYRKAFNSLLSFYDTCDLFIANNFYFNDRRKIFFPSCLIAFEREGQHIIQNLQCDFITISHRNKDDSSILFPSTDVLLPFSSLPSSTINRSLESIHPCNWEICFDKSHFYKENYNLAIPNTSQIHTIYLTLNTRPLKKFVDRFYKGRALMFCYGYASAQARNWYGNWNNFRDPINYKVLNKPITISSIFHNDSKTSIGFCCFQLNTLSFDSKIKNQVWFDGPYDYYEQKKIILKKMTAIQLYGSYNVKDEEKEFQKEALV